MQPLRKRRLGRTGLLVSELGLGGSNLADSEEGLETLVAAFSLGIDFVETGRAYKGSEYLIGRALAQLPDRRSVHVASKTLARSRDGALRDLEGSLRHLDLPAIDVYQLNSVGDDDWPLVTAEGGALQGLREAQEQGLVRFIGISSHSLRVLRRAIVGGEFDTIQVKWGVFHSDSAGLIRLAERRDIGVIGMKPFGGFGMFGSIKGTEYERQLTAPALLRYALSNPRLSVSIPGMRRPQEVEENVRLASSYVPMTPAEKGRLVRQVRAFLASMSNPR
jgi:aryl-alcohol dehydrogenase-like predicted oxidoreductase